MISKIFHITIFSFVLFFLTPYFSLAQRSHLNTEAAKNDLYFQGMKALAVDNRLEAQKKFEAFIKKYPEEASAYYELAKLEMENTQYSKARKLIEKAIELSPDNKWYIEKLAVLKAVDKDFEGAGLIFTKLARSEKIHDEYYSKAIIMYKRAKKYDVAIGLIDEMTKGASFNQGLELEKHGLLLLKKDTSAALSVLDNIISHYPDNGAFQNLKAEIIFLKGEEQKAIDYLLSELKKHPNNGNIELGLANFYNKTGDLKNSKIYIQKVIKNKTVDPAIQLSLITPYLELGTRDSTVRQEGLELVEQMAISNEGNTQIQKLLGDLYMLSNEPAKAAEKYKKALETDPSDFTTWQQLLYSYTGPKDADSLIKFGEKALILFPNQSAAHYLLGIGQLNKKDFMPAIKSINRAIDLQSDDNLPLKAEMYSTLADVYNSIKNYEESDKNFEEALKLDADNPSVLNNYAYYLSLRKSNLDKAETMSKKSLELNPAEATFLDTYGWILYQQGQYKDAKKYIQEAIHSSDQVDATLYDHLGDVYYQLGDIKKAVENWQKAYQLDDTIKDIAKKIENKTIYE